MAFYHLPNPWNPHYAIPKYVMAEPPGRGTFTTRQLPRGWVDALAPDYIAKPVRQSGATAAGCSSCGLGDYAIPSYMGPAYQQRLGFTRKQSGGTYKAETSGLGFVKKMDGGVIKGELARPSSALGDFLSGDTVKYALIALGLYAGYKLSKGM